MENFNYIKKNPNPVLMGSVEENTTFYYSNFKLFHEDSELLFASYVSFKKNLQGFLGEDWETYAKKTIFNTIDGSTMYIQSKDVFSTALEAWLELRREFNFNIEGNDRVLTKQKHAFQNISNDYTFKDNVSGIEEEKDIEKGGGQQSSPQKLQEIGEEKRCQDEDTDKNSERDHSLISESSSEDLRGFEAFQKRTREKFDENCINEATFKPLIQGFYISAIKVWKTTVANYSYNPLGIGENANFLTESKKFFLSKLQNVYKTKFKMLKPILVATERIKDFIYKDTSKSIAQTPPQTVDEQEQKNVENFTSSLRLENSTNYTTPINLPSPKMDDEQDLKLSFNNLKINPTENGSLLGKRTAIQARSVVEIKKMNKKLEKLLDQNMIEFAAHYVNNMTRTNSLDWQISRTFVTSMVEVNYNKLLQLENRLSNKADEVKNDIRIRFIQPAQDFYNRLMDVWIIFKTKSLNKEVLFTEYLEKVKSSLGDLWNEKFLTPTQNFFMTLYYEWNHLKQIENDTEEKILLFTKKVKESMLKIWEDNIVKKAEELTNKTITTSNRC